MTTDDAPHAHGPRLEVAPGQGWLARRPDGLWWSPGADRPDLLLGAFVDADGAGAAEVAVTQAVVDAGFEVDPFTFVTWAGDLRVVVMGALDVETDVASLPLLSGAGSATWVEHRVGAVDDAAVFAGQPPTAGTDLEAGVVRAGGFRLTLTVRATEDAAGRAVEGDDAPQRSEEPVPAGPQLLDLVTGGDWMEETIDVTSPPREGREAVPAPRLGAVITDEGVVVPIAGAVVVGRRPDATAAGVDDGAELCVLPNTAGVSRTHVVLRAHGGTMTATDCASRAGTLLAHGSADPVRLTAWEPHVVVAGDVLLLGGTTPVRISDSDRIPPAR